MKSDILYRVGLILVLWQSFEFFLLENAECLWLAYFGAALVVIGSFIDNIFDKNTKLKKNRLSERGRWE